VAGRENYTHVGLVADIYILTLYRSKVKQFFESLTRGGIPQYKHTGEKT